jgi:hypothetical protein
MPAERPPMPRCAKFLRREGSHEIRWTPLHRLPLVPRPRLPCTAHEPMTRNRNALVSALILLIAILGFGYFAVGRVIFLSSVTFIGGFAVRFLTTFRADIDPNRFLKPYLLTAAP